MKKIINILLVSLIITVAGCNKNTTKEGHFQLKVKIDRDFVLLPVEERGREFRMKVAYPDKDEQEMIVLRLAQHQIDYWVKIDVKAYKGKEVILILNMLTNTPLASKTSNNLINSSSNTTDFPPHIISALNTDG